MNLYYGRIGARAREFVAKLLIKRETRTKRDIPDRCFRRT